VRSRPHLHLMPRVHRDMRACVDFVARQRWGKPGDREADINLGIEKALRWPKSNRVGARRLSPNVELRRCRAAQFVVVYAYLPPSSRFPNGVVSIRAVRHSRVKDVFAGVKEPRDPSERWILGWMSADANYSLRGPPEQDGGETPPPPMTSTSRPTPYHQ
jgi:hypothetical protein